MKINIILEKKEKEFSSHMMYDPNSDKKENAKKEEDHERLAEKGFIHIDPEVLRGILKDEEGAAGIDSFLDSEDIEADEEEIRDALDAMDDVGQHEEGDYVLADDKQIVNMSIKEIVQQEVHFVLEKRKKQ